MRTSCETAISSAYKTIAQLITVPGVELAYADQPFVNEPTLRLPCSAQALIQEACSEGLHIGVSVGDRLPETEDNFLKISFSDKTNSEACKRLVAFFEARFGPATGLASLPVIPERLLRQGPAGLPDLPENEIRDYYQSLANLNVSPEKTCYPLGSCTMKYNPYINDWAASLKGFTDIHPQAPVEDVQGSLLSLIHI